MSDRSVPQMLPVKGDSNFLFSNFLIICLFNSSANYLLEIISFLTIPLELLLSINI